ncbi:baseplate J/gp47 family protein [Ferrimonas senticii]|uniref:baseplate J/gp47 family protein n=1 Tax=Ferrimonas senticii TaxID=394566 RepID=UPI00040B8EB5|nr:baseplate J/gp47 family protein [Ferrimonas senticii]
MTVNFAQVMADEGLPMTEDQVTAELEQAVSAAGSAIANDRAMSPFWRLVKAVVVTPVLWLTNKLIAGHVLPAMFLSTARGVYLELKGKGVDIERHPATKARGYLHFTVADPTAELTIAAGTIVETQPIDGHSYALQVVADTVITVGGDGKVLCEATQAGQSHNLPAGYFNRLPVAIDGIASVTNQPNWLLAPGQDQEQDEALAQRIQNRFATAGQFHIDAVYRDIIATAGGVRLDHMAFEHDAPRGPGTANCYIWMPVGAVPASLLTTINGHIDAGFHGHGDDLEVFAIPSQPHVIVAEYWPAADATADERGSLQLAIEQRIRAAFRELDGFADISRVQPLATFSISRLIAQCHQQLPALGGLTISYADITSGIVMPTLASLTITEVQP